MIIIITIYILYINRHKK